MGTVDLGTGVRSASDAGSADRCGRELPDESSTADTVAAATTAHATAPVLANRRRRRLVNDGMPSSLPETSLGCGAPIRL